MKVNSLAFRLFATAGVWTFIALPIVGVVIYSLIAGLIMGEFDQRLRLHAWVIQQEAFGSGREPNQPRGVGEPLFGVEDSGWYWQIKPVAGHTGQTLLSQSLAKNRLPSLHDEKIGSVVGDARWLDIERADGQSLRVVEFVGAIGEGADAPQYAFAVAGPLDWPRSTINDFATVLVLALALTGLALLAATLLQVKYALRPLSVIEKGLSDIRSGEAERLDGEFPVEIEPLQVELNALIDSNQDIIERARTQVGNLAHALKTPLAVLTNEAGTITSPLATKVAEQTAIMRDQVTHYLDRARMAARANTIGRMTPVRPVADGLKRALERIHIEKNLAIEIDCDENLRFRGERQDLEELLGNLLDNAAKWCRQKVVLTARPLELEGRQTSSRIELTIEDDGPGVPGEQRAEMIKRGQRLDETKPGSGLGLSIVNDLVTSYGGTLALDRSELGGLRAILTLPSTE